MIRYIAPALMLVLAAGAAHAHISADPREVPGGGFQAVRFRVGHGCHETAATTAVRIEMPPGLKSARPQPKPAWRLAIEHGADGAVTAVTWTGRLPGDQFDEFALFMRLPEKSGLLYFPTVQTCGAESEQWTEVADPGENPRGLKHPAPSLVLTPSAPEADHHH